MPPLSSRLNVKNLEKVDPPSHATTSTGSESESNSSIDNHHHKESSNDASNEGSNDISNDNSNNSNEISNSDSEQGVMLPLRVLSNSNIISRNPDGKKRQSLDCDADDEQPTEDEHPADDAADFVDEATEDTTSSTAQPKRFFCSWCNQGFTRKHNMVSHELIHLSLKPHICPVCSSLFRRIHDLKRHEKLHTGEKPFHCDRCNRGFARPDALTRHLNSPNACSGKPKDDETQPTTKKPAAETERSEGDSVPATPTDSLAKTGSSTITTEATSEGALGGDATEKPPAGLRFLVIAADTSSDSLGGISDIINKKNYDVHRWRAYQRQQKSYKQSNNFQYNQPSGSNSGFFDPEQGTSHDNARMLAQNRMMEHPISNPPYQGQHHHHHHYHHHHHNEENRSGMVSWSISSDREVHQDGQFIKHDKYYPRDIRGSRKESGRSFGRESGRKESSRNEKMRNDIMRNDAMRTMPLTRRPPAEKGFDTSDKHGSNMYQSYSEVPTESTQRRQYSEPNWPVPGGQDPGFVSMERYTNLVNYTNDLHASLSKMNDRITFLENAEHKRETDDQLQELATKKKRKSEK